MGVRLHDVFSDELCFFPPDHSFNGEINTYYVRDCDAFIELNNLKLLRDTNAYENVLNEYFNTMLCVFQKDSPELRGFDSTQRVLRGAFEDNLMEIYCKNPDHCPGDEETIYVRMLASKDSKGKVAPSKFIIPASAFRRYASFTSM